MNETVDSVAEEYGLYPGLLYFESCEGHQTYYVTDQEMKCVQPIADEEIAFAIRDTLDALPKMLAEIVRLRAGGLTDV